MPNLANMPLSFQLGALFFAGTLLAGLLNLAIYRLAWMQRTISPWGPRPTGVPPRGWLDRLPIVGWLRLRREATAYGRGFWVRPLLLELFCGFGMAALYWWEVDQLGLLRDPMLLGLNPWVPLTTPLTIGLLQQQFAAHVLLFALMLVATFIDIDEKSIPDEITVLGALAALVLAAVMPWSLLPGETFVPAPGFVGLATLQVELLHVASPSPWLPALGGFPRAWGLALGLFCFEMWCFALLPRTWYGRHGVRRAIQLCWARVTGEWASWKIGAMALAGAVAIGGVWYRGGPSWAGLLTSLVGLAVGAAIIWAVRLIGYSVLRREAMGFGDVTLMAMIGAFCGWQVCLLVFLLAPLAGVLIGVAQWLMRRGQEIPYGPFLCLATAAVIIGWAHVWDYVHLYFYSLGLMIPGIAAGSLVVMAILLWMIQGLKRLVGIEY